MMGGHKDGDDPWSINIPETEESWDVAAPDVLTDLMNQPLKIRKIKIGTEGNPKFENVGDYQDEETMEKIIDLLHEFQDFFFEKVF